ncbi:MAG: hypothetical protein ACI9E5_000950 [Candidatus Omnitrophota bacterium]|jgi:hypothetical protein
MSLTTYLDQEDLNLLTQFCADEIRDFYSFLMQNHPNSPYAGAMTLFDLSAHKSLQNIVLQLCKDKKQLFIEQLVKNGDAIDAHVHPVRVEVRTTNGCEGASQIAARGIYNDFRRVTLKRFLEQPKFVDKGLSIKMSGKMSFEVNINGVDKALPLLFLSQNYNTVLDVMGYKAGSMIDARKTPLVIAADADGTTYGFPEANKLPMLKESVAYKALLEFLELGGVYMVITGNRMERSLKRFVNDVPRELRSRLIIAANGAADMALVGEDGQFFSWPQYRHTALVSRKNANNVDNFNVLYLGDDGSVHGNDFPGFDCVGVKRSIVVCPRNKTDELLQEQSIGGHEDGTRKVLELINADIKIKQTGFELTEAYVTNLISQSLVKE